MVGAPRSIRLHQTGLPFRGGDAIPEEFILFQGELRLYRRSNPRFLSSRTSVLSRPPPMPRRFLALPLPFPSSRSSPYPIRPIFLRPRNSRWSYPLHLCRDLPHQRRICTDIRSHDRSSNGLRPWRLQSSRRSLPRRARSCRRRIPLIHRCPHDLIRRLLSAFRRIITTRRIWLVCIN